MSTGGSPVLAPYFRLRSMLWHIIPLWIRRPVNRRVAVARQLGRLIASVVYGGLRHESGTHPMCIVIVEPCLTGTGGHPLQYVGAIGREFSRRGLQVYVFANKTLRENERVALFQKGIACDKVFSVDTWESLRRSTTWSGLIADALMYAADVNLAMARNRIPKPRIMFYCSSSPAQVLGGLIHSFLGAAAGRTGQVHLMRYDPFSAENDGALPDLKRTHARLFRLLRMRSLASRLHLASDSEVVATQLEELGAVRVSTVPIPSGSGSRASATGTAGTGRVVGFLGGARAEKGALILPDVCAGVLARDKEVRIVAQVNLHHDTPELADAVRKMLIIANEIKRLLVIEDPLSTEAYLELLESVDIVLLPYDPRAYVARTSGICAEAMLAGKVIVGPINGWMSLQGERYGGYVPADTADKDSVVAATLVAIRDYEIIKAKALADAKTFAGNRPEKLAEAILGLCAQVDSK